MATQKARFASALDDSGTKLPTQNYAAEDLHKMCTAMLTAAGGSEQDSEYVAGTLVNASLAGVDSHGVIRMERYIGGIEEGSVHPGEKHEVIVDKGSMALMDGKNTFGQIVARDAIALCLGKAKQHGLAMVSCVNTGHIGRVGEYALTAAKAGYVALCCVNGGAIVAPFGSKSRVLGTNPICCAVPVEHGEPLLIDLATSIQAEGKVMASLHKGATLPEDTIINSDGLPSKIPRELYEGGSLLTVGGAGHGHKGSALSIMVDVLGGMLSGTGPSFGVDSARRPFFNNGTFFLCIDPGILRPFADFLGDVELLKRSVRAAVPRKKGGGEVQLPGEPELEIEAGWLIS
jgi:LDH2 family malate/lactate/ureidoglycolate dehydrogenase